MKEWKVHSFIINEQIRLPKWVQCRARGFLSAVTLLSQIHQEAEEQEMWSVCSRCCARARCNTCSLPFFVHLYATVTVSKSKAAD